MGLEDRTGPIRADNSWYYTPQLEVGIASTTCIRRRYLITLDVRDER